MVFKDRWYVLTLPLVLRTIQKTLQPNHHENFDRWISA